MWNFAIQFRNVLKYWSLWEVLHLGQVKFVNCNQILGCVANQNCTAKFHVIAIKMILICLRTEKCFYYAYVNGTLGKMQN